MSQKFIYVVIYFNFQNRLRTSIKLLICGLGSEARVFASIASSVKGTEVRVLPDRWNMLTNDFKVTFHRSGEQSTCITCKPPLITHSPEDAMKDVDIVVFMLPASAHEVFLHALRPYIKPGVIIVGLPGEPGFEFQVSEALGDVMQQCTIMNFESSPWVCNSTESGVVCDVFWHQGDPVGSHTGKRLTFKVVRYSFSGQCLAFTVGVLLTFPYSDQCGNYISFG